MAEVRTVDKKEKDERPEAIVSTLYPHCPKCLASMAPVHIRNLRMSGGVKQVTQWECLEDGSIYETSQDMRIIYHTGDTWEADITFRESLAEKKKKEDRRRISEVLDGFSNTG